MRVLVVEDNDADAAVIDRQLTSSEGGSVVVERCVRLDDALTLLNTAPFDVVLLDLRLPDSTGPDSIATLRDAAPDTAVIVLTGSADDELAVAALRSGAQEYLSKTELRSDRLSRCIEHAVLRQRLTSQLEASETRFSSLLGALADAALVVDGLGRVCFANPAAREFLRQPLEHGDVVDLVDLSHASSTRTLVVDHDGERRVGEVRSTAIDWDGVGASLISIRDITDRARAEELERRLLNAERQSLLGRIAEGMAHEVNNPAAFILANTRMLEENMDALRGLVATDSEAAELVRENVEMVAECRQGIERVSRLVRSFSAYSWLDRPGASRVDVNEACRDVVEMMEGQIRQSARLSVHLQPVPDVAGDPARLSRVVLSLVHNAMQAVEGRPRDEARIELSTYREADAVFISVADNGSGVPEALQERIFEPFFTTQPAGEGTGLGLAVARESVRKHGGDVRVSSRPGDGAVFHVVLPVDESAADSTSSPAVPAAPVRRLELLLIDDDPAIRRALSRLLSREHDVRVAASGAEALALIGEGMRPEVILYDLTMLRMDGAAFYAAIAERSPALLGRIIFTRTGAVPDGLRDFVASVDNELLNKPFTLDELFVAIVRGRLI